jgi:DNA-directed RNA polymerase specialized sigma24 family protein
VRDAFGLLQLPLRSMTAEASLAERLARGDGAALAEVLLEVEERTAADAARIASASEATMRTRLFNAKKKLRELLEKRGLR